MKPRKVNARYWLRHPDFGTVPATLAIQSSNLLSLGFMLECPLPLRSEIGFFVGSFIPLMYRYGQYVDLATGTAWEILDEDPATPAP